MVPTSFNLFHKQGADFLDILAVVDDATGLPYPLTDCTAVLVAKVNVTDATPAFTLTTADGTIVLNIAGGEIEFHVPAATWNALDPVQYIYELLLIDINDVPSQVFEGIFYLGAKL